MRVLKAFFMIGVYDPLHHSHWPWHCHYEHGQYLSDKKRVCSQNKAAEFETPDQARVFYHSWKHRERYKMEVIEIHTWVELPEPEYPEGHPREIFSRLVDDNVRSCYRMTFVAWFYGRDPFENMSQTARKRHRDVLLKYGVDVFEKPTQDMMDLWSESRSRNHSDFECQSRPQLTVVK
jgi:hypothetical protein